MYFFLKSISAILGLLPQNAIKVLALGFTFLGYDLLRLRRNLIMSNLNTALAEDLSDEERKGIARKSVYNFVLTVLEFFGNSDPGIADKVNFKGTQNLTEALDLGRGAYILCAHLGNWEALGAAVNRYIRNTRVLVKEVGSKATNRFVEEHRAAIGFNTIKRLGKMDAIRAIRSTLGSGDIVGFVMDQSRPGEPKIEFFGKKAKTNTSLATVWRRNPAPIIPACIRRTDVNHHEISFFPEITLKVTEDRDRDVVEHSRIFNRVLEEMIRKAPEQYFWFHNRWK